MSARRTSSLRVVSAAALVALLCAVFAGCQVALKADGTDTKCDVPEQTLCPGSEVLYCIGGKCQPKPPCAPKEEICNGVDDNCNGEVDEGFDQDADGYKTCGNFLPNGSPVANTSDCNDDDPNIHPGVEEKCNNADDNCDGRIDEEPNECSDKGQVCWSDRKDAAGKPAPGCIDKGDCRKFGCTTGGCDSATGKCTDADCTATGVCKPGEICDPKSHNCVKQAQPGDQCDGTVACPKGYSCLDSYTRGSICTHTCCGAQDCPEGLVCKSAGNAANLCVRAGDAGIGVLGTKVAHDACNAGGDCRSGVCTSNKCADVCCGSLTCGSGGTCAVQSDNTVKCSDSKGPGNYGDSCTRGCKSNVCITLTFSDFCSQHCCSSNDCPDNRDRCELRKIGGVPNTYCVPFDFVGTSATKRGGEACATNDQCRSNVCGSDGHCSDTCCNDGDCMGGYVCRPRFDGTFSPMRCVAPAL